MGAGAIPAEREIIDVLLEKIYMEAAFTKKLPPLLCPYCGSNAPLDNTSKIYNGRDFGLAYICENFPRCDSYVGVHKESGKPLGRLANKELRDWKIKAHASFDQLWNRKLANRRAGMPGKSGHPGGATYKKVYARASAYNWLATALSIEKKDCHIGMFDVDMCKKVVEVCSPYLKKEIEEC